MSRQAAALEAARSLAQIAASFESLSNQVTVWIAGFQSINLVARWQEMPTVALRPDGSPGAPDSTPNPSNPINLPEDRPLLISFNELIKGVEMLDNFQKWWANSGQLALPEQPNRQTAALMTH
jgi:hypothetical protein